MMNKTQPNQPKIKNTTLRLVLFLLFLFTPFILYLALTNQITWLIVTCEVILASVILTLFFRQ